MKLFEPEDVSESSLLEPNQLTWYIGPENKGWTGIDGESSWALLDSGSTINAVTHEFIKADSMDVGTLSDVANCTLGINGIQGSHLLALGLHHNKGSCRRSLGLWQSSSGYSCTRLYCLWIPNASYSGYTDHKPDPQHDPGKWNWWVVGFLE